MQSHLALTVVLGTGGTIAGTAAQASDNVGYTAGQIGVAQLVAAVPALAGVPLESEQVAQLDSKDMDAGTWQALALRVAHHLSRAEVGGVVVTHGTDTLEETAYFLHRVLAPAKPVVLTAAMRPATALLADGPQNLLDAVALARDAQARGVLAVVAGGVFVAEGLRKLDSYRLDAFGAGDAGPLGRLEEGRLRRFREWPAAGNSLLDAVQRPVAQWPRVEIVTSHAGVDARLVQALCAQGVQGIVVAATGNGTVHQALEAALQQARSQGVSVLRATRCAGGAIVQAEAAGLPSAGALTPVQARVELMLRLLG